MCAPRRRIVIELDGSQHLDQASYDQERTDYLESQGYKVIRFWNNDVINNIEGVMLELGAVLAERKRGYRLCAGLRQRRVAALAEAPAGALPLRLEADMAKTELKTQVNDASVTDFLSAVADEGKRNDSFEILEMMKQITKEEPKMWGSSIVGFGSYHYKGASGREGDWMLTGFSPRKQALTLYLMHGFEAHADLLAKLGKFTTGMGCLYIKKLDDVDRRVLKELVQASFERMKQESQ